MRFLDFGNLKILEELLEFLGRKDLCSTLTLIHIKMSNEPKIITNSGILVSSSFVGMSFSKYHRHFMVLRHAYHMAIHRLF
jgi:hypothetical protein